MSVRKQSNGKWMFEKYLEGGRRIRKTFATKGEALAYESYIEEQASTKPWIAEKQDRRKLTDLIEIWHNAHGKALSDGENVYTTLLFIADSVKNPIATNFSAKNFTEYRSKRLSGEIYRTERVQVVSKRTLNLELSYVNGMFNELIRLGEWTLKNPVERIRQFRIDEQEMEYLTTDEIKKLLASAKKSKAKDLLTIIKICLATGARWSEAESLQGKQVKNQSITYLKTKGKRNRTIPIDKALFDEIEQKKGALFTPCYSAFRSAIKRAKIELPKGQLSHVLRHTFGSHFMMNGGSILVLQKILGHTDIKMTMRYAHFAPEHFEDAIKLNPFNNI